MRPIKVRMKLTDDPQTHGTVRMMAKQAELQTELIIQKAAETLFKV